MTDKGTIPEEELSAAFDGLEEELKTAFDGLEEQLQGIEAELNSEETQAAFRQMTKELEALSLSLPDIDLSLDKDLLGGAQNDKQ